MIENLEAIKNNAVEEGRFLDAENVKLKIERLRIGIEKKTTKEIGKNHNE